MMPDKKFYKPSLNLIFNTINLPPWLSGIAQPWYVKSNKKAEVASSTLAGGCF